MTTSPALSLRRTDISPQRATMLELQGDVDRAASERSERVIVCRACGHAITREKSRIAVDGSHAHRRTNPYGFEFEFGCFRDAPGAAVAGRPTAEHTWFPGFAWSYALCAGCARHLGWFFEGAGSSFYGLVLERLAESDGE